MSDLCDISSSNHWLDAPKIRKETREYIAHSWNDRITILIYTIFSPIEHWKSGNAQLSQGDTPAFHLEWSRNAFSMSHGLQSPWSSPGQNTGVGSLSLLQGVFPTHGSNPGLLHCKQTLYQLSHQGSPRRVDWVAYHFSSRSSQPEIELVSLQLQNCRQILYQLSPKGSQSILWGLTKIKRRVGRFGRMALKHVKYHVWNELPVQVRCMILDAWGWCTGTTQRNGLGREEGGGFRMGNTCIPVADSFWYLANLIQLC